MKLYVYFGYIPGTKIHLRTGHGYDHRVDFCPGTIVPPVNSRTMIFGAVSDKSTV